MECDQSCKTVTQYLCKIFIKNNQTYTNVIKENRCSANHYLLRYKTDKDKVFFLQ